MLGVRLNDNLLQNIIMYYNDVKISIAVKDGKVKKGEESRVNVDSIRLYHICRGDITNLYTHSDDTEDIGEIYVDDGDELLDELKSIMKFVDRLNEFYYHARNYDPKAE